MEREFFVNGLLIHARKYRDEHGLLPDSEVVVKIPWWYETILQDVDVEHLTIEFDLFDRSAEPTRWRMT